MSNSPQTTARLQQALERLTEAQLHGSDEDVERAWADALADADGELAASISRAREAADRGDHAPLAALLHPNRRARAAAAAARARCAQ